MNLKNVHGGSQTLTARSLTPLPLSIGLHELFLHQRKLAFLRGVEPRVSGRKPDVLTITLQEQKNKDLRAELGTRSFHLTSFS